MLTRRTRTQRCQASVGWHVLSPALLAAVSSGTFRLSLVQVQGACRRLGLLLEALVHHAHAAVRLLHVHCQLSSQIIQVHAATCSIPRSPAANASLALLIRAGPEVCRSFPYHAARCIRVHRKHVTCGSTLPASMHTQSCQLCICRGANLDGGGATSSTEVPPFQALWHGNGRRQAIAHFLYAMPAQHASLEHKWADRPPGCLQATYL